MHDKRHFSPMCTNVGAHTTYLSLKNTLFSSFGRSRHHPLLTGESCRPGRTSCGPQSQSCKPSCHSVVVQCPPAQLWSSAVFCQNRGSLYQYHCRIGSAANVVIKDTPDKAQFVAQLYSHMQLKLVLNQIIF